MQFDPSRFDKMLEVQKAVSTVVDRVKRESPDLDRGLVALALARVIHELLQAYPPDVREQIVSPICDFLEKSQADRDLEERELISPAEGMLIRGATEAFKRRH